MSSAPEDAQRVEALIAIIGVVTSLLIAGWLILSSLGDEHPPPPSSGSVFGESESGPRAPAFQLRDENGRVVSARDLAGRRYLVAFVHAPCRGPCVPRLTEIRRALDSLRDDLPVLLVAADSGRYSPAEARRYLISEHLSGRAHFLLGPPRQLARVRRAFSIVSHGGGSAHDPRVALVDDRGYARPALDLSVVDAPGLARAIERALLRPGASVCGAGASADRCP